MLVKNVRAAMLAFIGLVSATGAVAQLTNAPVQTGDITRQQAISRADRLFDLLDVNHDGVVTRAEAQREGGKLELRRAATGRDVAPGIGGRTLHFFEKRFAGSESATKQQFEATMLAHFDQMDGNHDGILTVVERAQAKSEQASR